MHDIGGFVREHRHRPHHDKAWGIVDDRNRLAECLEKAGRLRERGVISLVGSCNRHTGGRRIVQREVEQNDRRPVRNCPLSCGPAVGERQNCVVNSDQAGPLADDYGDTRIPR